MKMPQMRRLEATTGFEPVNRGRQTSALPLATSPWIDVLDENACTCQLRKVADISGSRVTSIFFEKYPFKFLVKHN